MDYTFFGIQVVVKAYFNDTFRSQLHQAIARADAEQTLVEKRQFWKRVTSLLNEAMPSFEYGYWDLIREDKATETKAEEEFETWCSEIEGSLATEAEELGNAPDEVTRLSAEKSYVVVTLLFLVERGSNSDLMLGERCDLPEGEYFTRATFANLIAAIPALNFANVQGDAVYLSPGNDADGLSQDDLHGGGYEYLKPLG